MTVDQILPAPAPPVDPPTPPSPPNRARLELSVIQVIGSAVASVSAAAAASFLGVAGTIAGAAVGATVATVAGAVGTHSMRRATLRLHRRGRPDRYAQPPARPEAAAGGSRVRASGVQISAPMVLVLIVVVTTVIVVAGIAYTATLVDHNPVLAVDARVLLGEIAGNVRAMVAGLHR